MITQEVPVAKREMTPREKANGALFMSFLIPILALFGGCLLIALYQGAQQAIRNAFNPKPPVPLAPDPRPSEADEKWRKAKIEADKELARREKARKAEIANALRGGPNTWKAANIQIGDTFEKVKGLLGPPETVRFEDGPRSGSPKSLDYYWKNGECLPVSIMFRGRGKARRVSGINTGKLCSVPKSMLDLPGKSCKRNRLCR